MRKLSTGPFRTIKKTERKVGKGKGKETRPGCFSIPLRPRACAHAHEAKAKVEGEQRKISRYRLAGAAADEIIETCFGTDDDRDLWAYYCYHHDIETILEKARELKSRSRQGEIRNPVTAFQKWLNASYGRGV